jgi:long-chain acyl-CoA synthetase
LVLHTAGSTTTPKPVLLTQRDLICTARSIVEREDIVPEDELVAYLPLSWPSAMLFSYNVWLVSGSTLNIPENASTFFTDMKEIGPTFFFAPALLYKRVLILSRKRMMSSPRLDRFIFFKAWEIAISWGRKLADENKHISLLQKLGLWIARLLVFEPLKNVFGLSRLRVALTGLEPISPEVLYFFRAIGINLKQCYCVTESAGCAALNTNDHVMWNSIGEPVNTEIKLDRRQRILLRGPHIRTQPNGSELVSKTGWLVTGDLGERHAGDIRFVGRDQPESVVKFKAPLNSALIECILKSSFYIRDACVFGDKGSLVAIIIIDKELVGSWADRKNIPYTGYEDLASHKQIHDLLRTELSLLNGKLNFFLNADLRISRFIILPRELDKGAGELTRYHTIRRTAISERFAGLIEALTRADDTVEFCQQVIPVVAVV